MNSSMDLTRRTSDLDDIDAVISKFNDEETNGTLNIQTIELKSTGRLNENEN